MNGGVITVLVRNSGVLQTALTWRELDATVVYPTSTFTGVTTLIRDGLQLHYEVSGGFGPALLLPRLNFY